MVILEELIFNCSKYWYKIVTKNEHDESSLISQVYNQLLSLNINFPFNEELDIVGCYFGFVSLKEYYMTKAVSHYDHDELSTN